MKPLVFAGPSLHGLGKVIPGPFDLAPPAACGDVMRAVIHGRTVIGIIDGVFESGPAVWHKEILFALSSGCRVYGAASMGALRAAECWQFGMVGVGAIFEDYRSGRRNSDADVALVFGPSELSYMPLSVPLVDFEDGVDRLVAAGIITARSAEGINSEARRLHFKLRGWKRVLNAVDMAEIEQQRVLDWIKSSGPSAKARDALDLIKCVADLSIAETPLIAFEHTRFSERLLATVQEQL